MDAVRRPPRNPRFDRKRSRSRSPTVCRSLSPPRSRRHCNRSPSPAERTNTRAKRQRVAPPVAKGAATRPRGQVDHRRPDLRNANRARNHGRRVDGGDAAPQRETKPIESWADAYSDDEDQGIDQDASRDDQHIEDDKETGHDVGRHSKPTGGRAKRARSPCLVPDSESEKEEEHENSDDQDIHDHANDNNDGNDDGDDDDDDNEVSDHEDDRIVVSDDGEEEEGEVVADSSAVARTDDERTRALRNLASTTFAVSGLGGQAGPKRPRRSRRGKGSTERRRLRMMQKRMGLDAPPPEAVAAARNARPEPNPSVHPNARHADGRHAPRDNNTPVQDARDRHRHQQRRDDTCRRRPQQHATMDDETLRRQRISTIDAVKHIEAYHEACRRAYIDRVPPPPPPPENMFGLVRYPVDLFLAGRTAPDRKLF
nr:hypothetical protein [Pandoravirus massiliensis]